MKEKWVRGSVIQNPSDCHVSLEKQHVSKVLEETKGNKTLASKLLAYREKPFGRSANVWSAEKKRLLKIILLSDVTYW